MKHHQYPEERKEVAWERALRRMGYEMDYYHCDCMVAGGTVESADAENGVQEAEEVG